MKRNCIVSAFAVVVFFFNIKAFGQIKRAFIEDVAQVRMILVSGGTFEMGSEFYLSVEDKNEKIFFQDESPVHNVHITKNFWVAETETTVGQFRRFVQETGYLTEAEIAGQSLGEYSESITSGSKLSGSWTQGKRLNWKNPGYYQSDYHPVSHVSWNDAKAFCRWLSDKTGRTYRLLSEAEWEWAAGGQTHTRYSWGNEEPKGKEGGNIADAAFQETFPNWKYPILSTYLDYFAFPAPVGSYLPNAFGLFDMTGNVWEWVEDLYSSTYYKTSPGNDPRGPDKLPEGSEIKRVHRGGGFDWELPYLRVAKRRAALPQSTSINVGFRVALDEEPPHSGGNFK